MFYRPQDWYHAKRSLGEEIANLQLKFNSKRRCRILLIDIKCVKILDQEQIMYCGYEGGDGGKKFYGDGHGNGYSPPIRPIAIPIQRQEE
ncbi:Protein of unknown function D [Prunus dulcis]|uniref:Uncharacterized protein n=1 Tax=Prunus dulcis TaxID=3755 RepID=A0A4Y1RRN2_PRUDU|nr:Protein of unknown function D [Prunus dulcis]